MLPAFPTTTQKRDYCGPAVLELVLRHLGVDADQDTIAKTVKLPHAGSPMIRIARYLEAQKLETRRFEGTAARIRACIDLGLPVIVQEEYSTTTHVAVVAGVDEELGMLFVQDPMTHVTAERLTNTEERLGQLFRHAATVSFRQSDRKIAEALDAADVKDQEHIRLVDSCGDEQVEKDVEEVVARCDQAISLCEDYPLAWHRKGWELLEAAKRYNSPNNINRFLATLRAIRVRYGQVEWPHQIHAHYLMWQDRFEEALIEFEDALRIDPGDANNAQYIAEMHDRLDRADDATRGWWKALELDPSHVRATENFSSHALAQGDIEVAEHLARCALVMSPRNPFNHCTASRVAEKLGRHDEAVAHARKCIEVDPEWVPGKRRLAEVLRQREDTREEALQLLLSLCQRWKGWFAPRLEAASLLREMERVDDAVKLLREGIEAASDEPTDLLREAVEALLDAGREDEGLALAREVAGPGAPMGLSVVRLQMLARERRDEEATEVARDLAARFPDMAHTIAEAAMQLPDEEAEGHLRRIVDMTPTYVLARGRLVLKLLGRKPEDAVHFASGAVADHSPWLTGLRAAGLNDLGRWKEAEAAARAVFALDADYAPSTLEMVRAVVADGDPMRGLERLRDAKPDDELATRARLTLSMGLSRVDEALECAARLPPNDVRATRALTHAAEVDRKHRPMLEQRLRAVLESGEPDEDDHVWLSAVLAGSRGASGDMAAFDQALTEAEGIAEVLPMEMTLEDVGHLALRQRVANRARELAPDAPGVLHVTGQIAAATGDRTGARALFERATQLYPLDHLSWQHLGQHLLFELDPAGHELIDRALGMSGASFRYPMLTIASVSKLLRGQRDEARRLIVRARALACAHAVPVAILPLDLAVLAALEGDRAAFDAAVARHVEPEAKIWGALVS
jgi:tetratricopeptide (TPR) repeat protein